MRDKGEPGQCARWRKRHSKRLKRQQEVRAIPPPSPTSTPVFLLCERRCCSRALLFWRILCNRSPRHQASSIFSIIACVWKCCVRCVWRGAFEDSSRRCQWMDHWTVRLGGWVSFSFLLHQPQLSLHRRNSGRLQMLRHQKLTRRCRVLLPTLEIELWGFCDHRFQDLSLQQAPTKNLCGFSKHKLQHPFLQCF